MNPEVASTSLLAITSSVGIFNSLCPPFHEVRQATTNNVATVNDVRTGEIAAVALTVAIGFIGSGLVHNPTPLILSAIAAVALVAMYEGVLRTHPAERK